MKNFLHKLIAFKLITLILLISPYLLLGQSKIVGELTITKNSPNGFVQVNGETASNGRSIISTSEIITSPEASAKIFLPQTGTILISPNSKLVLSFIASSISGDLTAGEITVETASNTSLNLLTIDGAVTIPNKNQTNIVKVSVLEKKTLIQTLTGAVNFNNVLVSAGEFYPLTFKDKTKSPDSDKSTIAHTKSFNPLFIVGILGAVAGIAIIALSSSSNNSNESIVSPNR